MDAIERVRSQVPLCVPVYGVLLIFLCCCAIARAQDDGVNLLLNGSFESDGLPALEGWSPGNSDLATIVSPGGPSGGNWSLRLVADWAPTTGFVTQAISGVQNGDVLVLRANVKAEGMYGGGAIALVTGPTIWSGQRVSVGTDSGTWDALQLVSTLEIADGDSVWVCLTSFDTEIVPRVGLFDSVSLVRLTPIPITAISWGALKARFE